MKNTFCSILICTLLACSNEQQTSVDQQVTGDTGITEATVVTVPATADASAADTSGESSSNPSPPSSASANTPAEIAVDESEGITPPQQVTGAYLVAKILPRSHDSADEPLRVGLVALKNNERISDHADIYQSAWSLGLLEDMPVDVALAPSKDAAYDQILFFEGSFEEFEALASSIQIFMQLTEGRSKLNSLVSDVLSELVSGQSEPWNDAIPQGGASL